MIQAFYALAAAGVSANITVLSSGIYQALVTTVAGPVVGILALFAYNYLTSRVNRVMRDLEGKTMEFMDSSTNRLSDITALRKQFPSLATFSMSSMTDVIFLLLIFFTVTATLIFPAAVEVNLPQSGETTQLKPVTEVYIDSLSNLYLVADRNDSVDIANTHPRQVSLDELSAALTRIQSLDSLRAIALYADEKVEYGKVVGVARRGRTRPAQDGAGHACV